MVAAGGDGTLKAVATVVQGKDIPLGILPAGSANGMAKELGIPEDLNLCLDIITGNHSEYIDLININNKEICLHLSDFGLNAHLVKHFEESDRRGMWGYAREIWKVMRNKEQFGVQLKADGKMLFRKAWMVVIANARMYGTGATINPDGDVKDGKLEVIILRQLSVWELLKMVLDNKRFDARKTEIIQAATVEITVKKSAHFQIDGEYIGSLREISAVILPHALRVLLPPSGTASKA